jgi:hypothetical protein
MDTGTRPGLAGRIGPVLGSGEVNARSEDAEEEQRGRPGISLLFFCVAVSNQHK